jgi:hypothetical protein
MQVGSADPACTNPSQHFSRAGNRIGDFFDEEFARTGHCCLHGGERKPFGSIGAAEENLGQFGTEWPVAHSGRL